MVPEMIESHIPKGVVHLDVWYSRGRLSFVDCYHLALTKEFGMTQIYTFDKKMDRYPGVARIEP